MMRFWSKVLIGDGCWEWQAFKNSKGYGCFRRRDNGSMLAHRIAWELVNGPIPAGMQALHVCDNRACVKPGHLYVGTVADNMKDRDSRGRLALGEQNGKSKLTVDGVKSMRRQHKDGVAIKEIAKNFGINQTHASRIVRGLEWRHVTT